MWNTSKSHQCILHAVLKAHKASVIHNHLSLNPIKKSVFFSPYAANNSYAQRFFCFHRGYLYNKSNLSEHIFIHSANTIKIIIIIWIIIITRTMKFNCLFTLYNILILHSLSHAHTHTHTYAHTYTPEIKENNKIGYSERVWAWWAVIQILLHILC